MGQDPPAQVVAGREVAVGLGRRDSVDRAAQHALERNPSVGLEQQGIQIERAELPVSRPRLALAQPLERADVDEHGTRAAPLDVVRRGVLQDQPVVERRQHQVELQQRRLPEHREAPLVRIRDEGHPLVAQDARDAVGERGADALRDRRRQVGRAALLRPDQAARGAEALERGGRRQRPPVLEAGGAERPEDALGADEHAARGVAERSRIGDDRLCRPAHGRRDTGPGVS